MKLPRPVVPAIALAVAFVAVPAHAVDVTRTTTYTAAGACQVNNPATSDIRVRIGALLNNGTTSIYVVCSAPGDWRENVSADGLSHATIRFGNTGTEPRTISCTFQPGYATDATGAATYQGSFMKTVTLAPGTVSWVNWNRGEIESGTDEITAPNFICLMPPTTTVNYLYYTGGENVGA